jgi:peptidoglycan/LPS O-acetylase OafA/YrhL
LTSARNYKLDALRGIAAISVVFHHVLHLCAPSLSAAGLMPSLQDAPAEHLVGRFLASVASGGVAVNIFFILSGAVLMDSLAREERMDGAAMARFACRRILRIYPAMILAVIMFAAASHVHLPAEVEAPFNLSELVANLLLLDHGVLGSTWTLQTEMLMLPVLLALAVLQRTLGTVALVAFLIWAESCFFLGPPAGGYLLNVALTAFALGALIPTEMFRDACRRVPAGSLWILFAALIGVRFYFPLESLGALLLLLAISAAIVALLYYDERGDHFLENPVFRFLGRISYSVYLQHVLVVFWPFPLFLALFGAARVQEHYVLFALLYGAYAVPMTVALAILPERYVERPFIRLGSRLFPSGGRRGRIATSAPALNDAVRASVSPVEMP